VSGSIGEIIRGVRGKALACVAWLRARNYFVQGTSESMAFIQAKQLELLYRGFLPGAAGTMLVSMFFALGMWRTAEPGLLLGWLAAVWGVTLLRALLVRHFGNHPVPPAAILAWENRFAAGAAVAGGLWGTLPFLFIPAGNDAAAMLVVVFISGVSAAGSALLAPSRRTVLLFLVPSLVPLAWWMFSYGDRMHFFMGAAVTIYLIVLLTASRRGQAVIWSALLAGTENERLKGTITAGKMLAEEREKTVDRLLALERENVLFRRMVEGTRDLPIVVHDCADKGRIVYVNDAACRHFETDRATLLTWYPSDFDPQCDDKSLAQLEATVRRGESSIFESEHHTATGTRIPVEVSFYPLQQDDGQLLSVSYVRDLRAHKTAEAQRLQLEAAMARRVVEEQYRDLVEALPDFVTRLDAEARHVYINPLALQGTGRDESAFLGKTVIEVGVTGSAEGDELLYEAAMKCVASGEANTYEAWWDLPGGRKYLEIRHIPEKDEAGRVVSILGIARDITKRIETENALQFVAQRGWAASGESFLPAMARYLGEVLNVDYVIIDKLVENTTDAETVALFAKGAIQPNLRYSLIGTPCENVMGGGLCCYARKIQQRFPEDTMLVEMGVESYIGLPLWDSLGQPIGLIAAMDSKPMADADAIANMMKLMATRAAAELERDRSALELRTREQEYRRLLDSAPDIIVRYDTLCRRVYSNAAHARVTKYHTSLGKTPVENWAVPTGQESAIAYQRNVQHVLESGQAQEWELGWTDDGGEPVCYHVRGLPEFDREGRIVGVLTFAQNISERKQYEMAIQARLETEDRMSRLFSNAPGCFFTVVHRIDGVYAMPFASSGIVELCDLQPQDVAQDMTPWIALTHPDDVDMTLREADVSARDLTPFHVEYRIRHPHKGERWIEVRSLPQHEPDGSTLWHGFMHDITVRKQLEAASAVREQEFRALVENSPDFITRFDRECRRIYINPSLAAILKSDVALGTRPTEYYAHLPQAAEYEACIRHVLETGEEHPFLFRFPGREGREYSSDMRIVPERDSNGAIVGVLAIGRDIGDRLRLEDELQRQASYDTLTGLPNRRMFSDRLREEIVKAGRSGEQLALLFIDLDRFKEVNDTLGHESGDQLLVEAARRIHTCVRESDTVARLGGDEFVAIFPGILDISHLGRVAQNIVDILGQPFHLAGQPAYVSASIGIAGFPMDADAAEALLACADQAMYAAKSQGRNGFSFFTSTMQAQAERRLRLANELRGALTGGQLQVHYQPIVDIATGEVVKAEALLRWRHPASGMISPADFIPVAEETGLIHDIGDWVFREAAQTALRWREARAAAGRSTCLQVSVNISPRQFIRSQVADIWIAYLADIDLPAECMVAEITEGLLLGEQEDILDKLGRLREAGIRVALDDFGTGYSAMAYLKRFNIDYLKIDRSFVRDLSSDESDRAIAEAIVVMARKLGLKTIAEGVETDDQRDILAAVGCEYVQGYLYARPMPVEAFLEYVAGPDAASRMEPAG
jgi:diguanylate cyclase (GGDEF)-like protein/PAS domain S-box-containing protein